MGKSKRKVLWQEGYIQVFVDEKGIISREEHSHDFGYSYQPLIDFFLAHGYKFVREQAAQDAILPFVGRPITEFEEELCKRAKRGEVARKRRSEDRGKWKAHVHTMTNLVIGIDSIDFFEAGFHVWVLLNSHYPYQEQSKYIKSRHREIVRFIQEELRRSRKSAEKKAVELLPFSKLTEVTLTRRNIVQYTFEIKEGIQEVLKESEPEP
jgi:hypothetical protein